jgi:hypothetical protein
MSGIGRLRGCIYSANCREWQLQNTIGGSAYCEQKLYVCCMKATGFLQQRGLFLVLMFGFCMAGKAQNNYFVYLQNEGQQPFTVSVNRTILNSSGIGYVILPKLQDSTYSIRIGLQSNATRLDFDLALNGNDQGYLIKNFGDKGWGLFNLHSLTVQMAGVEKQKRDDALAQAEAALRLKQQQEADSLAAAATLAAEQLLLKQRADSLAAADAATALIAADSLARSAAQQKVVPPADSALALPLSDSLIDSKAVITHYGKDSSRQIAIDSAETHKREVGTMPDTAIASKRDSLSIMPDSVLVTQQPADSITTTLAVGNVADTTLTATVVTDTLKISAGEPKGLPLRTAKFLDIELGADSVLVSSAAPAGDVKAEKTSKPSTPKSSGAAITSNNAYTKIVSPPMLGPSADSSAVVRCKNIAEEKDFFNLRRKMAAEDNNAEAMIVAAKKAYKSKCFTTLQVGNLAVLFLTDADKYAFLDASYPFVSDRRQFAELGNMLNDAYYKNRFKAMLQYSE